MLAHRQLLDLIEAALTVAAGLSGVPIQRHRSKPLANGVDKVVRIRLLSADPQQALMSGLTSPLNWSTQVAVACIARAGTGETPDEAVEPVLTAAHAAVVGATSLPAAGFVIDPAARLLWEDDEMEERIGAITAIYTVTHRTAHNTLVAA